MKNRASKTTLLPNDVIEAAVSGDSNAINVVLVNYGGYITSLATGTAYDEYGYPHRFVNEELRHSLESHLVHAILRFSIH